MKLHARIICLAGVALGAYLLAGSAAAQVTYVGSDSCKPCHEQKWNDHRVSGHPYKLSKAEDIKTWPVPLPEGHDWDDISYVIGGYRWKARYMDLDGYIITEAGGAPGANQYNLATGEWVDYHPGEVQKPYDCGPCHTTGYSYSGNQDGLPGITGTWEFPGIECERCHGPGSAHVAAPSIFNISVNDNTCTACHVRGDPAVIPASGGFVKHHEQHNEMAASPHFFLDCVTCHDPHKKSEFSFKVDCTTCHVEMDPPSEAFKSLGKRHNDRGIDCVECHMPYGAKSAAAVNQYKGDVRSHQWRITLDPNATFLNQDGTLANGRLTADIVCLGCHDNVVKKWEAKGRPEKAVKWARKWAKKIHK